MTRPLTARHRPGLMLVASLSGLAAVVALVLAAANATSITSAGGPETVHVDAGDGVDVVGCGSEAAPCRSIQSGIDNADAGDTVQVSAGSYAKFTVDKLVAVNGAGSGSDTATNTVVSDAGQLITIEASGTSTADRLVISNLRAAGNTGGQGIVVDGTRSFIALDNVSAIGNDIGLDISADDVVTDLQITDSSFDDNLTWNMRVNGEVTTLDVSGSSFDGSDAGWQVIAVTGVDPPNTFDDVTVTDTTFNDNRRDGIYVEKLSNALFDGITVDHSGFSTTEGDTNSGIEINLKHEDYANIEIKNSLITDSGTAGTASDPLLNAALAIRARDDLADPATLSDVTLKSLTVSDNVNGIVIGHPLIVQAGPTDVVVSYSDLSNNSGVGMANVSSVTTLAMNNWWGCNEGPGDSDCASAAAAGVADLPFDPWLTLTLDVGANALKRGESTTLNASVTINSDGDDTSGDGAIRDGTTISFGPAAQVNPDEANTLAGVADTTFTAPGTSSGNRTASATLDNETVTDNITFGNCQDEAATIVGSGVITGTTDGDVIIGRGVDDINARGGDDLVCASTGDDIVDGGSGNDIIEAGGGDDDVQGDNGNDVINGGGGNDILLGNGDDDELRGKEGDDELEGGSGLDALFGGNGEDTCNGGADADTQDSCELP